LIPESNATILARSRWE